MTKAEEKKTSDTERQNASQQKKVLSDEEIQEGFERLGLGDEAKRAELLKLRARTEGTEPQQIAWSDSVADLEDESKSEAADAELE